MIKILGRGNWREKRGTVSWISCGACEGWFHANGSVISAVEAGQAKFHCPHCQHEFDGDGAREMVLTPPN